MKYALLLLCCSLLLIGCADEPEPQTIFVGGQINNPETDYVIVSRENETIDTLYLDQKNQFGKDFKNLEAGIYTFKHPPESQIMYMEPGDSIIIWLNTMSFDESLNFSGDGAEKSNFLLDMFLNNQKNNDLILTYHKIAPEKFAAITDSIRNERLQRLDKLKEKNKFSEDFLEIARASINYEYYDLRERYTFLIKKYYSDIAEEIPEDFNAYRDEINFNNHKLQDYYVYTNLIDDYLRTKSIEHCAKNHDDARKCYNLNDLKNLKRRMRLIDSLTNISSLKNEFLDRLSAQAITLAENEDQIESVLEVLEEVDYASIEDARDLGKIQKAYLVGNNIKKLKLSKPSGEVVEYDDVIRSPSVVYAWSIHNPGHHQWQHAIINRLREKYPEVNFIGGNVDLGEREEWLRTLENYGYDKSQEFQITNRIADSDTYRKYLYKILFVDQDGTIINGKSQLAAQDFEEDLLEFLNSK
ncbi:hypothetical protein E0K83_11025 [Gramella sp. BOM4]|nr:hypothetical protein [Christiangramia bathymodioli]